MGSRPIANSVSALLVALMFANLQEPSSLMSSKPPAIMALALPDKRVSHAVSREGRLGSCTYLRELISDVQATRRKQPNTVLP